MIPVPIKYIQENEILTDKELANKTVALIEEVVKTSPEFDQYFFDHREEILEKKNTAFDIAIAHGKAILDEQANIPKCPTCQSASIRKVSVTSKVTNTALFGIFGTKRYKTFHCNNCGYEW